MSPFGCSSRTSGASSGTAWKSSRWDAGAGGREELGRLGQPLQAVAERWLEYHWRPAPRANSEVEGSAIHGPAFRRDRDTEVPAAQQERLPRSDADPGVSIHGDVGAWS